MNEGDQRRSSTEANLTGLSDKISTLTNERQEDIDRKFRLLMAEEIWMMVKGVSIPDSYSEADRLHIFERYYHRASAQRQGE
jgi:hypothetical protein